MISRNYDVLVVDPSPGALAAAALLARAGLGVLVLRGEPDRAAVGRFRFYRHRPPVIGFEGGLLLPPTLKALKFHPHERQSVRSGSPGLQVIGDRYRLDVHRAPDGRIAELRREFPADADALDALLQTAATEATRFAEQLDRAVDEAGQATLFTNLGLTRPEWSPPLPHDGAPTWGAAVEASGISEAGKTLLFALLRPFCAIDDVADLPLAVAGMHLVAALDGVYADPSEEDPLLALLLRRVQAMRVDVVDDALLELKGGKRKIEAAVFEGRSEEMPLRFVLTGGDPEALLPFMPGLERTYEKVLGRLAPSHFRYAIYLGVRDGVIPPDLAEHAILVGSDAAAPGGTVLLSVSPPGSPLAPEGLRAITASTLVPYTDDGEVPGGLEAIAATMLDRIKWLMPFLERHIEVLQVPNSLEPTDDEPMAVDPRPAAYTPAVAPADDPVGAGIGVSLPQRNVFCAGPAAFPALGLGGEFLAGRLVERLALASLKKER